MPIPYSARLRGRRILVVEDSYLIAQELAEALEREGAEVIGPVSTLDNARRLAHGPLDAAVLDVNLGGEMIWPVADFLLHRGTKLVFATGLPAADIKARYASSEVVQKPIPARAIIRILSNRNSDTRPDLPDIRDVYIRYK